MDLELTGKRALVTGASTGIGKAIARELLHEGARVVGAARTPSTLQATAEELSVETGGEMHAVVADTGDDASVQHLATAAMDLLGGVDILVNNAARPALGGERGLAAVTKADLDEEMNVKVMGYIRCAQAVAPFMVEQGWGRIINVSGLAARISGGSPVHSIRNVSVTALTKNLADELGPSGVNVTVVYPGMTRTERTEAMVSGMAEHMGISEPEAEAVLGRGSSLQRMIDAQEVAWLVTFLASPRSVSINGEAIACGGGTPGAIRY